MYCRFFLICALLVLGFFSTASARDITLEWDPNTEPDIAGYKIYYKADAPDLPLDGAGAAQGASPVDVGALTKGTLSGLEPGRIYYFAVTAYNSAGYESSFSNIVASDWIPVLSAPADGATASLSHFRFDWQSPPPGYQGTFTLCYGTDPDLNPPNQAQLSPLPDKNTIPGPPAFLLPAVAAFFSSSMFLFGRKKRGALSMAVLCLLLTSCGGGGGENAATLTGGTDNPGKIAHPAEPGTSGGGGTNNGGIVDGGTGGGAASAPFTRCISGINENYYAPGANDLKPGTNYYWKVTAVEAGTEPRVSVRSAFVTESL